MDTYTIWNLFSPLYLGIACVCVYVCVLLFLSVLFNSLNKCLMSFSCVPGTILGTASVRKATSALGKLTPWDLSAGSCADVQRQPRQLYPGHS